MRALVLIAAAIGSLTQAVAAADGILIVQQMSTAGTPQTTRVQIEKTRMRTEITDQTGARQVVVFDAGKQTMYMINLDRKSYSEITKADIDRLGAQSQDMMAKMQAQMANMPPEAREKMEAMLKGRGMGAAAPAKTEYRKTGTDKAGKWPCDKYEGFRGGQKVSEVCTVDPSVLGFTAADFAITQQFSEFFGKLIPDAAGQAFGLAKPEAQGFAGLPVKSTFTFGARTTTTEIVDASRRTFPDADFAVPAGFEKQAFMGARGRGRQ